MEQNIKTVAVVCNFRTGSTAFTIMKADEYELPYEAEIFSHDRPGRVGSIPQRAQLQKDYFITQAEILDLIQSDANYITELNKPQTHICFKVMPGQVEDMSTMEEIVKSVDKVIYLYRRDFEATCKSWVAVRRHGDFHKTGFIVESPRWSPDRLREVHLGTKGKDEKHIVTVDPDDAALTGGMGVVTVPNCIRQIQDNYERMAELYKKYPGELVCMEDYFVRDKWRPYNKEVNWVRDIDVPEFDVESLFSIDK